MASSSVTTWPVAAVCAARMTIEDIGFRLCGIAEEPPRPGTCGSATSPISVEDRRDTSVAILASAPISVASQAPASTMRARST